MPLSSPKGATPCPLLTRRKIWASDYTDCAGAAVTVLAAGVGQKPAQSRLDYIPANARIWREGVPQIARHNSPGIPLVATDPVDVLTYAAWRLSGLPQARVIGSGTILDTARFFAESTFWRRRCSVYAYIVGEHGDSQVPVWSLANIAGIRLPDYCRANGLAYDPQEMQRIFESTRDAGSHIIERKPATYYCGGRGSAAHHAVDPSPSKHRALSLGLDR